MHFYFAPEMTPQSPLREFLKLLKLTNGNSLLFSSYPLNLRQYTLFYLNYNHEKSLHSIEGQDGIIVVANILQKH